MSTGSPDYYTPDAHLADSLIAFSAILAKLHTTTKNIDDVMNSLGINLNSLTVDIKTLLATLRSQAMGDSTTLHTKGDGTTTVSGKQIFAAWAGRTGFSVGNNGATNYGLRVGGSTSYGMAMLIPGGHYINDTYCGAIRVRAVYDIAGYCFEEW